MHSSLINLLKHTQEELLKLDAKHKEILNYFEYHLKELSDKDTEEAGFNPKLASRIHPKEAFINGVPVRLDSNYKSDLFDSIVALHSCQAPDKVRLQVTAADKANYLDILDKAFSSKEHNSLPWKRHESLLRLGEIVKDHIIHAMKTESFSDNCLEMFRLTKGETGRIEIKNKTDVSYFSTSNPDVSASQTRQSFIYPSEGYLQETITFGERDMSPDSMLGYIEQSCSAFVHHQDTNFLKLLRCTASSTQNSTIFETLTPQVVDESISRMGKEGLIPEVMLLSCDQFQELLSAQRALERWQPPEDKLSILDGFLGTFGSLQLRTDSFRRFRHPSINCVLEAGETFILAEKKALGGVTLRSDVKMLAVDKYSHAIPEIGWHFNRINGLAIITGKAVIRLTKLQ